MAAEASRTITRSPCVRFFLRVLLAQGGQYRAGRQPARAYADVRVIQSKLAALRPLEFLLTNSLITTCPRLRHGPSEFDARRPVHSEAGSSSTCAKHTFMWNTCQAG